MADELFRHRGVKPVLDTTEQAEWDIQDRRLSEDTCARIARRLIAMPVSPQDRIVGDVRIRELEGFDIVFMLTREQEQLVVTWCGLEVPDPADPTEEVLKRLGPLATLRGAFGV